MRGLLQLFRRPKGASTQEKQPVDQSRCPSCRGRRVLIAWPSEPEKPGVWRCDNCGIETPE